MHPVSVEIGEIADYASLLQEGGQPLDDSMYPCLTLPWDEVTFTCENSTWAPELRYLTYRLSNLEDNGFNVVLELMGEPFHSVDVTLDDTGGMIDGTVYPILPERDDLDRSCRRLSVVIAFMAIAFLHTKQGANLEDAPPLSRQVRRNNERKGVPTYERKILTVPSIRNVVSRYRSAAARGVRLHIVRGHWADYRENGLCGNPNNRGIFWKPPHVRGDKELGEVSKDYHLAT